MARYSHTAWAGVVAVFLATTAMAGPPVIHDGSRTYGNSMGGGRCDTFGNLHRCVDVHAWENYDVKGTFEYTEVVISLHIHRTYEDGSWSDGWRYLSCPVDRDAITARPNTVTLDAVLDRSAPGCYSYGQMTTWHPIDGYSVGPWEWIGPTQVAGEWLNPFSHSKSVSNHKDTFYDGWSDTKHSTVRHCNESYGDLMQDGGFGINHWYYPWEGVDTPGWSYYHTMSCNENNKQK